MNKKQTEQVDARNTLWQLLRPGATVYTILRSVSRSGMSRTISVGLCTHNGWRDITALVGRVCGYRLAKTGPVALKVGGCGMDMGFSVVYNLGAALFKDWSCTGGGCPSNDHHNPPNPPRVAYSMTHRDGGYALRQQWV